jgi:hypothetical protein
MSERVQGMVLKEEGDQSVRLERASEITPDTIEEKLTLFQVRLSDNPSSPPSPHPLLPLAHWIDANHQRNIELRRNFNEEDHWPDKPILPTMEGLRQRSRTRED